MLAFIEQWIVSTQHNTAATAAVAATTDAQCK